MSNHPVRVLIVEQNPDLGEIIRQVLDQEGYAALWQQPGADLLGDIRNGQPDLVVLDLPPRAGDSANGMHGLLDALRVDRDTAGIPVLAISTSDRLAQLAAASYNIRATLTKPFNLDDFLQSVQDALDRPPLRATVPASIEPSKLFQEVEQVFARRSREALLSWVQRLQTEEPWRSRNDLRLVDMLDTVPVLFEAVVASLQYGDGDNYLVEHPEAFDRIYYHAVQRHEQQIPLWAVVREYTLLRHELWKLLRRTLSGRVLTDEVFDLEHAVNYTLDRIIEATIPAYLDAVEAEVS